ncbi:MAG: hypothetical protein LAO77_00480 [Acidobacteriia bacterium]|nr:hypothetical protein [Terriglobia bacterium]
MWPTERASRQGLLECAVAAILFPPGVLLLRRAGLLYLDKPSSMPLFWSGLALLVLCGVAVFRIASRREYPWLLALAAVALPLFDPTHLPYTATRMAMAARDLILIGASVWFVVQSVRRADELERRIHFEALAWSYTAVLIALMIHAMAADALPPLRATWVASGLLAGWVVAWLVTSVRYQR